MLKIVRFLAIFSLFSITFSFAQSSSIKQDTPLIQAVKADNKKEVNRLLMLGVDVNELGQDYKTALDVAVEYGYADIATSLIKHKAKVTSQDNEDYIKFLCFKKHENKQFLFECLKLVFGIIFIPLLICSVILLPVILEFGCCSLESFTITIGLIGGYSLVGYMFSLSSQIRIWDLRSRQNWMLPALE